MLVVGVKHIINSFFGSILAERGEQVQPNSMDSPRKRPTINLLRSNGDLLPEVEGDTITFERDRSTYGAAGNARLTASLKFARRTDITEEQAQPVVDEFIAEIREWVKETFRLETPRQ